MPTQRTGYRGRLRTRLGACLVLIALVGAHPAAFAEHEADHRYTVSGYLLENDGSPISAADVLIKADGAGARAQTDGDGYYSVLLHLHNEDLGKRLDVVTDHGEATVRVTFDPSDRSTARVHHVNLIGGKLVEGPLTTSGRVPRWLVYLTGLIIVVMLASLLRTPLKRLRRRVAGAPAKAKAGSGGGKTRARKKKRKRR